ncbi:MAG: hypothetical protein CMJ78_00560 [Planctomycetaceae bacterium]|nr:hypothetical protein [Planctomycetaceae bacterium]
MSTKHLAMFALLTGCSLLTSTAEAQKTKVEQERAAQQRAKKVSETQVEFELLTGRSGQGLYAQKWGREFRTLGARLRIRRSVLDDKPQIKERMFGTIRKVTVTGVMDRSGKLIFPMRSFSLGHGKKLAEWIRELRTYGSQGSPEGKPLFGLNQGQFARIYNELSETVKGSTRELLLEKSIEKIGISSSFGINFAESANAYLKKRPRTPPVRQEYKEFSKGLALASLLNEYGLGFKPTRTPEGSLELQIRPLEVSLDRWPIGWPPKTPNLKTAPKLYKMVPVELDKVALRDVLDAAATASGVPILVDYYHIEKEGGDISKEIVSYPSKRTTWSLLLKGVTNPIKLTRRLMIDENGRAFVWVTTIRADRARL